jgi:crotonobetainyl-CoA:carnitine CoA-transferase CaiB-like acyl-CoA transferase
VLVDAIGLPELALDPRFSTNPDRVRNRVELRLCLEARLRERSAAEWEQLLGARSIPCSRVRTVADLVADEQLQALGLLAEVPHPLIPNLRLVDLPINHDGSRTKHRLPPPQLGEHTNEVLRDLGYATDRIVSLENDGVIRQSSTTGGPS